MTLEDFFTLNELKDGLLAPVRVNELLTVMQNEKDHVTNNVGETTRQWSAVANTIATTVNQDCLDLFVQLDGLWFIDRWLNDAQKFENITGNGFVEELIVKLLRAIERLQVDSCRSESSGIGKTVMNLLDHKSSVVREKAKALCDWWVLARDADLAPRDAEKHETLGEGTECKEENVGKSGDQKVKDKGEARTRETNMESANTNQDPLDPVDSSGAPSGNLSVEIGTHKMKTEGTALSGVSGSTPMCEEQLDVSELDKCVEDAKDKLEINPLDKDGVVGEKALPPSVGSDDVLESGMREDTSEKDDRSQVCGSSGGGAMEGSPGGESKSGEDENPKTTSDMETDEGDEDEKKDDGIQSQDDSENGLRASEPPVKARDGDLMGKRPSDMEMDYGMVDPLEVARQVAIEVEREVDSQERSCSTSQNVSGCGTERPKRPDSTSEKERESIRGSGKEVSSGPGQPVNDVETLESKRESCKPDIPVTQISELAQESAPNAERGFSGFDLNQEVSSEEIDGPVDPVLTPISVVSASRAAAADGLPGAPLQFEGTLGWKGSAATSAFRRIPESGNRLDRLDFDLNVAEDSEDKTEDFFSQNELPIACGGEEPSGEKLQLDLNSLGDGDVDAIASDWKQDGRVAATIKQNGPQSPSLSSSSSSMHPSFRNFDLNSNDHMTIPNNASLDHNPFLGKLFNNSNPYKQDESVISIFGTQVEVNRNDSIPHPNGRILEPAIDFSLGRGGSGLGLGSLTHYANLPAYGHNGFTLGPAISYSLPYGPPSAPIPYMVDSRGAPFVPQIMGSSSALPPAFSQPPTPFMFNMAATGTPSGSNGAGPSHRSFDLNAEGVNRENNGGLRQFLGQASLGSIVGGKRHEPDSGWEAAPVSYKHQQPPWQ